MVKVLYESTPISEILWHNISGVLLELFILYFRQWTVRCDDMLYQIIEGAKHPLRPLLSVVTWYDTLLVILR